jgi:hypothetical protein
LASGDCKVDPPNSAREPAKPGEEAAKTISLSTCLKSRPLCPFTFFGQNHFKPAIRERSGKGEPRGRIASDRAKLGSIWQQFASPDTEGPPAHDTVPVDATWTRIAHCSFPTPTMYPSSRRIFKSELRAWLISPGASKLTRPLNAEKKHVIPPRLNFLLSLARHRPLVAASS